MLLLSYYLSVPKGTDLGSVLWTLNDPKGPIRVTVFGEEAVLAHFKLISRHSAEVTEKTAKNLSEKWMSLPILEFWHFLKGSMNLLLVLAKLMNFQSLWIMNSVLINLDIRFIISVIMPLYRWGEYGICVSTFAVSYSPPATRLCVGWRHWVASCWPQPFKETEKINFSRGNPNTGKVTWSRKIQGLTFNYHSTWKRLLN